MIVAEAFPELGTLEAGYRDYIAKAKAVLQGLEAGLLDDEVCFATRMRNLWEIYSVAKDDPILPPALLPEDWPRFGAVELSAQVRHALSVMKEAILKTASCLFSAHRACHSLFPQSLAVIRKMWLWLRLYWR